MEKILLTFTSVNFTMMTESKLVSMGYDIKTIPTPREISESLCRQNVGLFAGRGFRHSRTVSESL